MPAAEPSIEDQLRERLARVVRDHPQARLARLTGRSRTALTRYMQGARLPLEFGCALCAELGVNADWLLNGRGPMYVTDQPSAATGLGRNLLELIRTMDAVANVKVGLLAGKAQATALREISDGLARYGSLRERLHARTRPVMDEVLQQLKQALDRNQYERAAALEAAASSLERFTDDPALSRRLMHARAHILQVRRQLDRAAEMEERLFLAMLGGGEQFAKVAEVADSLAVSLRADLRPRRARKVLRLALACADEQDVALPIHSALLSQAVMTGVELGDLHGQHELLAAAMANSRAGHRVFADIARMYFLLYTGALTVRDVAGAAFDNFPAAAMVLGVASLTEDAATIERALSPVRALANPQMPLNLSRLGAGEELLAALHGRHDVREWTAAARRLSGKWDDLEGLTRLTQLLRIAGSKQVSPLLHAAQVLLDATPPDRNPLPVTHTRHLCNVLRAIPADARSARDRELRARALREVHRRLDLGYGILRELEL